MFSFHLQCKIQVTLIISAHYKNKICSINQSNMKSILRLSLSCVIIPQDNMSLRSYFKSLKIAQIHTCMWDPCRYVGRVESEKSRVSSQVSAASEYLGRHLHKEQIPAVLTLRKPGRQDIQTNALPIKATILTVCNQEPGLSVMTQSLHLHDSMTGDLSPAQGAILIGEVSWESVLRCGRKGGSFSPSWSPIYFVPYFLLS